MHERQPLTGTALDFGTLDVPCPSCGQMNLERVVDLIAKDKVPCRFCRAIIDVGTDEWRARINKSADAYRHLGKL